MPNVPATDKTANIRMYTIRSHFLDMIAAHNALVGRYGFVPWLQALQPFAIVEDESPKASTLVYTSASNT